ncbi:MAG: SUMF1/EgtB/PvdO family nonheme iron enzyme [Anaerolineales bacterium]|nr:SUMF1/EgtB/PvdO family nonheme iron enzyme [Anaerolineales bacterium]
MSSADKPVDPQLSQQVVDKKADAPMISGDQNSVEGTVTNGGIVIQGSGARVEIVQNFITQSSPSDSNNLAAPNALEEISIQYFEPETIYISSGAFWMGSEAGGEIPNHETPQHQVSLVAYRFGKYPVTNNQYEEFVNQTGRQVASSMGWNGQRVPSGKENYPVAGVTWYDALAYCQWLGERTERKYSLPNEAQWEKACRGENRNYYPWGNEFDPERCNHGRMDIAPVGAFPAQNEYGCFDLVGNIRQWTCTLWGEKRIAPDLKFAYPWTDDRRNDINASRQVRRVVRGSSMKDDIISLRCSFRSGQAPDDPGLPGARHGFRVVLSI